MGEPSLGIPQSVSRQDVVGMGCHAGLNSFKSAAAWACANPGKYALACGVEVLSAQYCWGSHTMKQLNTVVVNSLFADGCFCAVLWAAPSGCPAPQHAPAYLDAPPMWWTQLCDTAALPDMIYRVERSESKYVFDLSELAPYHVGQGLFTMMHVAMHSGIPVHHQGPEGVWQSVLDFLLLRVPQLGEEWERARGRHGKFRDDGTWSRSGDGTLDRGPKVPTSPNAHERGRRHCETCAWKWHAEPT